MSSLLQPPGQTTPSPAPSAAAAKKAFDIVDIKQYFHIVVKRIWLVAICFVISLSIMFIKLVRQVPSYRAMSTLLLSREPSLPVRSSQSDEDRLYGNYISTQIRIIQSPLLVARARERLNRPADEVGRKLINVNAAQIGNTAFLGITISGYDPVFCADFANALAEEYLDFKIEERTDNSQATVVNLTQQANRLHEELIKAEERSMAFIREHQVAGLEQLMNIASANMATLASQAARYKTERMILEAQQPLLAKASDETVLAALTLPGGGATLPLLAAEDGSSNAPVSLNQGGPEGLIEYGVVAQPGWASLKREHALLEARLAAYRKKYRDAHPKVQELLAALQNNENALEVELQFALRQYYAQLEALSIKEQAAARVQKEWQDQALESSKKAQEYRNIQRNYDRLQRMYDLVFNRLKEVDIAASVDLENIRIMERAKPSFRPVTPRKIQSLFMAALVGLGLGLGLVFGLEYLDDSVRYPEEVTHGLGMPFLGMVPSANWEASDLRAHLLSNIDQKSGLAEAYRNVRSALLLGYAPDQATTWAVTSAVPQEGKTTTTLNLAISLAQAGSRVLVVDADLRRGELHKFFGLEGGRGLSDLLLGQIKPEAVIQRTGVPHLDLIATGPFPPSPAELLLRPEMHAFMDYARRTYDRVLFDCPPVMAVSEAAILAAMVQGAVLVVWAGHTSRKLAQMTTQILRERGANLMGCVLNNLEFNRVGYYYYSTYYGYYDYDYRYGKSERGRS